MEQRRRSPSVSLSLVVGMLMTVIVPAAASFAADEPKIAFLNPSSFSAAGERGYIISNAATDSGPGCCDASDGLFRFSAWVDNAPVGSSVFFTVVQGALDYEIVGATRPAGSGPADTWDGGWDIPPEVLNGPATAHAYLVQDGEAIAHTSLDVTIMRVEEAVDLAYPESGGSFGTYAALATALPEKGIAVRKKPMGIVDALYTVGPETTYVRTFYTTTPAGSEPVWKVCATETVGAGGNGDPNNGIRCTFASAADAAAVTAVAAVVNGSPNDFDARFNQSGDAVRVAPYAQQPAALTLDDLAEQTVSKNEDAGRFYCSDTITATVTDQLGRLIPAANVDVEAVGPSDGLRFHTSLVFASPVAPDRGRHVEETAFDCTGSSAANGVPPTNPSPDVQGEHPAFGAPDAKHVESAAGGTNDRGTFGFRLYSNAGGVTQYTVWADEADDGCLANDDRYTTGEVAAAGSVGWSSPPSTTGLAVPGTVVPCGDAPVPSPEPTDPGEPLARSIGLRSSRTRVPPGTAVRLSGRVRSAGACVADQVVTLKARRPGGRFRSMATVATNRDGRYRFKATVRKTRGYRALLPETSGCTSARSRIVRVRVS
ncbi:MAG: hypothetical protein M3323_11200 [Actinomycetota bacterium]|nr:hypothetical protein [Actinomycetota bacterium]